MSAIPYDAPEEDWVDYQDEESAQLPGRPRRRWWGRGTALLGAVLLGVIGFYVGVRVEKGQLSSSASTGSGSGLAALASRFGRGAAGTGSGTAGASGAAGASRAGAGAGARALGLFGGGAGGSGSFGTVSSIKGNTIYLQTSSGNVIKVTLSSATKVTKNQGVSKSALRPGDTVVVAGVKGSNGSISATSVSDSGSRSTSTGAGAGASSSSSSGSSAVNSLFGSGAGG